MSKLVQVEIFWDGDGWYFAHPGNSERLGGPNLNLHALWLEAHNQGYEVVDKSRTRGMREYRSTKGPLPTPQKEDAFKQYMSRHAEKTNTGEQAVSEVSGETENARRLPNL